MQGVREIIAVFLAGVSLTTVPLGLMALYGGLNGRVVDAEYSLNVETGLIAFFASMLPPISLVLWFRLWRGKWHV